MDHITVVGAGLAGSEAAWQAARRGIKVRLYEMRPQKMSPAHHTPFFAELVCSNSLRANNLENAVGLLKEEMRQMQSLVMDCAERTRIPAGGALAVDRMAFAKAVTEKISEHPNIEIKHEEITQVPTEGTVILATGPLTGDTLANDLKNLTGEKFLYFYDAVAPIINRDTIDPDKVFWASRYDKGEADYLNCPMTQEEYEKFFQALVSAEVHEMHEFEKEIYFEGCMPVEVMAKRGPQTLLFGPLKPVGLLNPLDKTRPYAVVQLRKDNICGSLLNMVGFQTHLKWSEQKRVFRMIPGLENAEFVRYGVMHRNTFINSPCLLLATTQLKEKPNILIAGQLSGVEGYVESAASGLIAGINASRYFEGLNTLVPPRDSAVGSLLHYITHASPEDFQPMNITFGLMPELNQRICDKKRKKIMLAQRALDVINEWNMNID